jgi:uncharacterized protein
MTAILLGLVVGIILALTGAGGGILAVPLLVFGAGIGMASAAPIGLMAVGMAAALGALLGLREGIVRYRAALLVAAAGMVLSPLGLLLAHRIDARWLALLFSAVLLYVGLRAIAGKRGQAAARRNDYPCVRDASTGRFIWTAPCARALALAGALAGLLSGLLGVGGGFVMVPALNRYTDLAMQSVVATSLAVIALVSASGVVASAVAGQVAWAVALPFCAGAFGGMLGGRRLAARLSGPHLQAGFGAVACLVAFGMALKSF